MTLMLHIIMHLWSNRPIRLKAKHLALTCRSTEDREMACILHIVLQEWAGFVFLCKTIRLKANHLAMTCRNNEDHMMTRFVHVIMHFWNSYSAEMKILRMASAHLEERLRLKEGCSVRVHKVLSWLHESSRESIFKDVCASWRAFMRESRLRITFQKVKSSQLRVATHLEQEFIIRVWRECVALSRTEKGRSVRLKSRGLYEVNSAVALERANGDLNYFCHQVAFDSWGKLVEAKKYEKEFRKLSSKVNRYELMSSIAKAELMKSAIFDVWLREVRQERFKKDFVKDRVLVRRKNLDRLSPAVVKWAHEADLGIVLRAFCQNVADARAAVGENKVLHVQRAWRSSALHTTSLYANALEFRSFIKALLAWKVYSTQERRDTLRAQCDEWSQKFQQQLTQYKHISSHCDALRQNLAVQLLSSEQRSEEAMDQSDKLRGCTGELWTEMHRQNLTLDSLEHEVLLLEAQNNGSHLYRSKPESTITSPLVEAAGVVFSPRMSPRLTSRDQLIGEVTGVVF
jgi:hypothetical protein